MTNVLDASAILRFLDNEAGAARVDAAIADFLDGRCGIAISAVNWGEVATTLFRKSGMRRLEEIFADLDSFGFQIVDATPERAIRAGLLKAQKKIPYADAFAVELAASIANSVLLTADFDLKPAAHDVKIEFLQKK